METNFLFLSQIFKALSDETRLKVLFGITKEPKTVGLIAEELKLSQPLVSHHLKILKDSFLVKTERKGAFVYYRADDVPVIENLMAVYHSLCDKAKKQFT